MIDCPHIYDNFLPADLYNEVRELLRHAPLSYGHKSSSKVDPYGHLKYGPIHDRQHNLADLAFQLPEGPLLDAWGVLRAKPAFDTAKLIRCYANGYTYGMDGYFHTDSQRSDEVTVILYICDKWDRDWAGETVCVDRKAGWLSIPPSPNRCLMIPSNMPHAARAVSRMCPEMRMTLMYKTRPKRSDNFEMLSEWLVKHHALDQSHAQGTLHDHLVRTYALLEAKTSQDVAFGGGLHSIYGTNVFKHRMLDASPHARAQVAAQFGKEAESLAYSFSVIDRPKALENHAGFHGDNVVLKLTHDATVSVPLHVYKELCLIECANLADQNSLDKWPNLKGLWDAHASGDPVGERLVPRSAGGTSAAAAS